MKLSPRQYKWILNFYPPYIGAGVKINDVAKDWSSITVSMALRWYNRNAVGTQFGGSLYSMTDPHIMLILMQRLGREYIVWDKSASIDYIKPGSSKVTAHISVTDQQVEEIKALTSDGDKHFAKFDIDIKDEQGNLIAQVHKVIYVRKKKR